MKYKTVLQERRQNSFEVFSTDQMSRTNKQHCSFCPFCSRFPYFTPRWLEASVVLDIRALLQDVSSHITLGAPPSPFCLFASSFRSATPEAISWTSRSAMSDDNNMESDDNEGVSLAPFDPKASDFIPEPEKININASASASAHQKPRLTLRSTSGLPGDGKADWKPFHSAIPLYPSTIWSPSPHTNPVISAGIPQKPSWDSFTNTPTRAGFEPLTPGEHFASPLPGLGMPQGQTNFLHAEDGRIRGANTGGSEHVGRFARSEQYHMLGAQDSLPSPVDPSVRAMSFQPPQHLARLARQQSDSSSELDSDRRSQAHGQPANVSNLPHANLTINVHANTAVDGHKSGSSGSNAISDHHTQQRPVSNGAKGEV